MTPPEFQAVLEFEFPFRSGCHFSMMGDQIRKMRQAVPFQPFEIHLANGRSLSVVHPECLAITPAGRTIGVGLADNTIEIVDLLLVTSLKPMPNGRSRHGKSK